jgi:hypothetical protein
MDQGYLNGRDKVSEPIGIPGSKLRKLIFINKQHPEHIEMFDIQYSKSRDY